MAFLFQDRQSSCVKKDTDICTFMFDEQLWIIVFSGERFNRVISRRFERLQDNINAPFVRPILVNSKLCNCYILYTYVRCPKINGTGLHRCFSIHVF